MPGHNPEMDLESGKHGREESARIEKLRPVPGFPGITSDQLETVHQAAEEYVAQHPESVADQPAADQTEEKE